MIVYVCMTKLPAKSWEYIPELEDEKDYVVDLELWNLCAILRNITQNRRAESPVYQKLVIPHLQELVDKLETLQAKLDREIETGGDKTIYDLIEG
jgi:hypothetical protein